VLGIDFGSEFFKVSLISPGKSFMIIENTTTKRKTENVVAFANQERYYEADGGGKRLKNGKNTFVFLKKFLGALANDE
jgi:hypoxia up-regulated 1